MMTHKLSELHLYILRVMVWSEWKERERERPILSPHLNPIEHLRDYFGRQVAVSIPPPKL